MNFLSDRLQNLSESETLAMTQKSRELKAQGFDVINLSIGEPDFDTPEPIKQAGIEGINDNYSHYAPVSGYLDLREANCKKQKRDNDLEFTPDQIVVSNGAKQSIANVVLSLVNPGDEVIVPAPYWVSYKEIIKLAEGKMVTISATIDSNFKITPAQLEQAITPKTKLFIYSSPCNPTGTVYSKEELKAFADIFARNKHIFIISDEIYEHINFIGKHESIAQFAEIKEQVIVVNGVSKAFAMPGWRIGYMAAPKFLAKACDKLQGQITSAPSSIAMRASIKAISSNPSDCPELQNMKKAFRERRDLLISLLKEIPGIKVNVPDGAFYLFINIVDYYGKTDGTTLVKYCSDMSIYILNKAHVALLPGIAFGNPNCIRFSYATSKELIIEAASRIKKALSELK